jgi:hypothetical protein
MRAAALSLFALAMPAAALTPAEQSKLPPPVARPVDFAKEIKPLLESSCIKCHAKGKAKGGLSLENRESFLKGGETGPAVSVGHSGDSLIVEMVAGLDPEMMMPKKGSKWTPEQVGLLRAWIDQGAPWPADITFARPPPNNLEPRQVTLPDSTEPNPVDRLLAPYFAAHQFTPPAVVDDARFVRRAYLDVVGLLPTPEQLQAFLADGSADRRAKLVRQLLVDHRGYADHWLTFWNDLLRNDYRGTGFIDGGRRQISEWLYNALLTNKPYDRFVSELINPTPKSLGFSAGIIWRGTVPAAMAPPMQAAQSVSQVFMGINIKCASCHDSFVNDWSLADAYGMAAIYSDSALELIHCDKPTGQQAATRFLYPALGEIPAGAGRAERVARLAELITSPQNGRLSRTLVNRLWARLFARSLVEPLDDMDQPAWSPELLDWLAEDFADHGYDVRHTLEVIMTSRAYQLPAVEPPGDKQPYVFRGPLTRRLGAEQFADAVSALTGQWAALPASLEFDFTGGGPHGHFTMPRWIWTPEPLAAAAQRTAWRIVKTTAETAQAKSAKAQQLTEAGDPKAAAAAKEAQAAAQQLADVTQWAGTYGEVGRHKIVFRKRFTLAEKPTVAYATIAASQLHDVQVNGTPVKHELTDGARNNRIRLYNFAPLLRPGENLIAVSVDSHTEKSMNETEARQFPASREHLNARPGFACYLRARHGGNFTEIVSDESWRVRRAPETGAASPKVADQDWARPTLLPEDQPPIDEGPGLPPLRRKDFANVPALLGEGLRAACSTAALAGHIRASQLVADPLQVALDRPNREIVTPARPIAATTLQALELTNGSTLAAEISRGAAALVKERAELEPLMERLYQHALSRKPAAAELKVAHEVFGTPATAQNVEDLIWALLLLPEFQFLD